MYIDTLNSNRDEMWQSSMHDSHEACIEVDLIGTYILRAVYIVESEDYKRKEIMFLIAAYNF